MKPELRGTGWIKFKMVKLVPQSMPVSYLFCDGVMLPHWVWCVSWRTNPCLDNIRIVFIVIIFD